MSTPPEQPIALGDVWVLTNDLGIGLGAIPAGAEVTIEDYLEPFTPGVGQTEEWTVVSRYTYLRDVMGPDGTPTQQEATRRLAYADSEFRARFVPAPADDPEEP